MWRSCGGVANCTDDAFGVKRVSSVTGHDRLHLVLSSR